MAEENRFNQLFEYELQNRAFATEYTQKSSSSWKDKDIAEFWATYHEYEVAVKPLYRPYAEKHDLSVEQSLFTSMKTWAIHCASVVAPNYTLDKVYELTVIYLEDLKELQRMAPKEDSEFFRFVVEQEEIQIEALRLAASGHAKQGTQILRDYTAWLPVYM